MRTAADRTISWSMRCYRGLLRAYPQAFLAEFEDLLCQAFGDLAHRAVRTKGLWGLFVLWLRTIPDLISSAFSQRFRPGSDLRFRLRWILACTAGVVLGAACVIGPARIFHEIRMWFVVVPTTAPATFVPVLQKPEPVFLVNFRILRDVALLGLVVGLFQSLVLELKRFRRVAWTFATALGSALAAGAVLMVPFIATYLRVTIHPWRLFVDQHQVLYYGGGAIVCASIIGMLQTFVLARQYPRALVWVPASAIGILTCSFVVVVSDPLLYRIYRSHHSFISVFAILGVFVGIVYGLITVLPLEWILQPGAAQDVLPSGSKESPS